MARRLLLVSCVLFAAACGSEGPTFLINDDASDGSGSGADAGGSDVTTDGGGDDDGGETDGGGGDDAGGTDGGDDGGGTDGGSDGGGTDGGTDGGDDGGSDGGGNDGGTDGGGGDQEICDNGVDDDGDTDVDCDDADCAESIACGGTCGDGTVDDGEECDDGDANSDTRADACRRNCELPTCGDGVRDTGEACDEGDDNGFGRCTLACVVTPICGDGVTDAPEECDDGNDTPGDGCTGCFLDNEPECGDGLYSPAFEECDADQGCAAGDTCTDDCFCESPVCGDGAIEGGEECDGELDAACGDSGFCNEFCECQTFVCGNDVVEGAEECDGDAESCLGNAFCSDSCMCETYECGDNSADGTEECDGTDDGACGAGEACSGACVCVSTAMCGNDITEGDEECDGADDSACGSSESCNDDCECQAAICGNGVAEGTEECDGADDALCGAGRVCDSGCACDGPPRLTAFGTPVVGGANPVVIPAPNRSDDVCEDLATPHGLRLRVQGDSTAPIVAVEVQRSGIDPTPIRVDLDTPIPAGSFDERVDLCLPTFEENRIHQITLLDDEGRRSDTRSFSLPTLGGVTFSSFRVFLSRDQNNHILQFSGTSADANLAQAVSELDTSDGPIVDFASVGWVLFADYSGDQFAGAATISGLLDIEFTVDGYETVIETYGGLRSAARTATAPTTVAGSGSSCVPAAVSGVASCQNGLWCQPGGAANAGTCRTAPGGAPVLSSASHDAFTLGSDACGMDFPNELSFRLTGTTNTPLVSLNLTIPGIIDEPASIELNPVDSGAFDETIGLCFSGGLAGETVQISVVDEGGRTSATRSYVVP